MKVLYPLLSLMAFSLTMTVPSCKAQPQHPLSGHIETDDDWKPFVYLVKPRHFNEIVADYLCQVVDSAAIAADGSFSFQNLSFSEEKILLTLAVQKKGNRFANHLADEMPSAANYMPIVLTKGDTLELQANVSNFQRTFTLENPLEDNQALMELRDARIFAHKNLLLAADKDVDADSLLMEKEDMYIRYTKVMRDFADGTESLEAALVAIRWVSPNGDYERMPEFLHGQCAKWHRVQPYHPFTIELCDAADKKILPVMIGDVIPDFIMPLVTGDTVRLHLLLGKQLTLVDIWASWCAPCRKENREILVPLWSTFKKKGLQIVAYSIDSNDSAWKAAITKDGATWTHASHLSGDATPFMEALRITTIPANYILDGEGKIIAKNLHGVELSDFVKQYLE
ncbi:MAG: TlpA disulfide reductase family protein [Saprospiraceae bacterium]|nr:TlpA disulfide reductase family protein [Saprospiraceae bacterium]